MTKPLVVSAQAPNVAAAVGWAHTQVETFDGATGCVLTIAPLRPSDKRDSADMRVRARLVVTKRKARDGKAEEAKQGEA